jgi:hypothetical protein
VKKAAVVVLLIAAIATGMVLARSWARPSLPAASAFHGVRLGMTASAVRERFEEPALGAWQSMPSTGAGDVVLAWTAAKGPDEARFEFHAGMLVAVRAVLDAQDAETKRPHLEVSSAVARLREEDPNGARITILARDCPTHRAEAERIAGGK